MNRSRSISTAAMGLIALALSLTSVSPARATSLIHKAVAGGALGSVAAVVAITTSSENCTGSVIAPKVVLTAAHCLEGAGNRVNIRVRPAHTDQNLGVSRYFIAPGFNAMSHHDDAAVLILKSPSSAPALPVARSEPVAGSGVRITGYGQRFFTSGATTLAYSADTIIQSPAYCQGIWAKLGAIMPSSDVCAQNSPLDNDTVTRGDSGGPLLMKSPAGHWVIAGINDLVVIPNDVYSGALPQAFGRVTELRPWLESEIARFS